ncbi:MAG TPA: TRAM domain-containing protein [Nitrososphaeraceae archaeon]|jgi:predicted RNA-binding protein with TRAM domain|nr:TRAM domain-containing protein [Nitrososphaeraceae archaeon]
MKVRENDTHRISSLGTHGRLSKPVEIGNEYEVEIIDRGKSGSADGIAKIQGLVIFVKGGKVGDKVRVKITAIGERFAKAELVIHT